MRNFDSIVRIRRRRSERAVQAESAARRRLEDARRALEEAREAAEAYRKETATLEMELIAKLLNRAVTLGDLQDVEVQLKKAQKKAEALADRITVCKNAEEENLTRLDKAKAAQRDATRRLSKSEELETHFRAEAMLSRQAAEDALIDEFCETAFIRGRPGS